MPGRSTRTSDSLAGGTAVCPGGTVVQDTRTTLAATETPTPTWTPTVTPTATTARAGRLPTVEPTSTPDAIGYPYMAIDANPSNGVRPCLPIDSTRTDGPMSGAYQVAICLVNSLGTPDAWEADVLWSRLGAAALEVPDQPPSALDDNPDFNNSAPPYGFGNAWSCPSVGPYYPKGDNPNQVRYRCAHQWDDPHRSPFHPPHLWLVPGC